MARLPRSFGFAAIFASLGGILGATACTSILGDFDVSDTPSDSGVGSDGAHGDSAVNGDGSAGHDGAAADGSTDDGSIGDDGSISDACAGGACADVNCAPKQTACGPACFDLTSSSTNCGKCGHDCGGASCSNSACQPSALVTGIGVPTGFTIDSTSLYYSANDVLKSCPLDGCASGAKQLAAFTSMNRVEVANGNVTFVGTAQVGNHPSPGLYACPVAGCGAAPPQIQGTINGAGGFVQTLGVGPDLYVLWQASTGTPQSSTLERCIGVQSTGTGCTSLLQITSYENAPLVADGTNVYFAGINQSASTTNTPAGIQYCANGVKCAAPTNLITGGGLPLNPTLMAVTGGNIYFVAERDVGTGGTLYMCPVTGCTKPTTLDKIDVPITSLAADATGIYLGATIASRAGIYTCPLDGCGTIGPVSLATSVGSPTFLHTDAHFVYWVDPGVAGTTSNASIQRVAK